MFSKTCMVLAVIFCISCSTAPVQDNRTVPSPEVAAGSERALVVGTVWQWVQTLYSDGQRSMPSDPQRYTINLLENGDISAKADCNMKGGRYTLDGNRLSLEITRSTRRACEVGSLEDRFVRDLSAGTSFFRRGDELYIELRFDSGVMKFSRQ